MEHSERLYEVVNNMGEQLKDMSKPKRIKLFSECSRCGETSRELLQQTLNNFLSTRNPDNILDIQTGSYKNFLLGSTMGEYEECWYAHVVYYED